jgi:hypothetical protein
MKTLAIILVISLLAVHSATAGPVFPTRGILIHPRWGNSKADTTEFLGAMGGWGSVYHGFNSTGDEFGWSIDLGALFEIARWGEHGSLLALTDMELDARTNNDIYFNPRTGFWEEGLFFASRVENFDWQFGYLHRCRHDIDNGDTNEYQTRPPQRTLIYGSLSTKVIFKPFQLFHSNDTTNFKTLAWLTGDLYVFKEDYRQPSSANGLQPNYHNILFSLGVNAAIGLFAIGPGQAYLRGGANVSAFGSDGSYFHSFANIQKWTVDGRAELGYQAEGRAARFQLFAGWESFQDDGMNAVPQNSHFTLLGIRLSDTKLMQ